MRLPALSLRMKAIISLVPPCDTAAEIGADHGLISAGILAAGRCRHMLVGDVSAASLEKARRLFASLDMGDRVTFRVADGLQALDALETAAQVVVVAGMGAKTMTGILASGRERVLGARLVLQANPGPDDLRVWLCENGYRIEAETLCFEEGRFYIALRASQGREPLDARQRLLGPRLLENPTPLFYRYARHRLDCARVERGDKAAMKTALLEETIREMERDGLHGEGCLSDSGRNRSV